MADTSYGWAGWIARVNLTSGAITEESDVEMQKDYIGGMGFANKIMYDEVPAGVDWMDEENKAVLAVGPSPVPAFPWLVVLRGLPCPPIPRTTWLSTATAAVSWAPCSSIQATTA